MHSGTDPVRIWKRIVPVDWIDYNGHLTEGYYSVAFAEASDELLIYLGFGATYRATHGTFFTVETRVRFLQEVPEGAEISTASYLLGADAKRLHVHHDLMMDQRVGPVATQEVMLLHVTHDQRAGTPHVSPMAEPVLSRALDLAAAHSFIPLPPHIGQGVRSLR